MSNEANKRELGTSNADNRPAPDGGRMDRLALLLQSFASVLVIAYLGYRLTEIGWVRILHSLPLVPWFYVLLVLQYCALPVSEIVIYRRVWRRPLERYFPVLLRKRVLNFGVLGYLGEGYFALWARQALGLNNRRIFGAIKDVDILSALVSNFAVILLVIAFMGTREFQIFVAPAPNFLKDFTIFGGVVVLAILAIVIFRRHILSLDHQSLAFVLTCHVTRLAIVFLLQVSQWVVVLPNVPKSIWLAFLTAQLVMTRIPLLPSQDLMVLGLGVALASIIDVPEAAVTGMFVAAGGLNQLANLVVFTWTSVSSRWNNNKPYKPAMGPGG